MKTLLEYDTIQTADSVEFCPFNPNWLALGTYQNQQDCRIGQVSLIDISTLQVLDVYITSGILDIKWIHESTNGIFISIVTSTGQVILLEVIDETFHLSRQFQGDKSTLLLSLDWSNRISSSNTGCIVSGSDGNLLYFNSSLDLISEFKAHSFEAWISAFDYWNSNVLYSGGDDGLFKGWDIRGECTFVKKFQAGVTSISSHPLKEFILASGSYDESLNIWDTRYLGKPLSEIGTGGGVWRIKWNPYHENLLMTANMYNGFHVLSFLDSLEIKLTYKAHESIAYGVDWAYNKDKIIFGTCSFYDHLMHVVELDNYHVSS